MPFTRVESRPDPPRPRPDLPRRPIHIQRPPQNYLPLRTLQQDLRLRFRLGPPSRRLHDHHQRRTWHGPDQRPPPRNLQDIHEIRQQFERHDLFCHEEIAGRGAGAG